jgi:transcriptional regulator with AAA-type ATPase domain
LRERKDDIALLLEYYAGGPLKTIFTPESAGKTDALQLVWQHPGAAQCRKIYGNQTPH